MNLENSVVKKDWQGKLYIEIPQPPKVVYLENLEQQKQSFEQMITETQSALDESEEIVAKIKATPEKDILSDGNSADIKVA